MDNVLGGGGAVGVCVEHAERAGTPCARCGTFRCEACLQSGLCEACAAHSPIARAPTSSEVVGFGLRAGGRIIDTIFFQLTALIAGVTSAISLALLSQVGLARDGWVQRLDHGFFFNLLASAAALILGGAVTTVIGGASLGKVILRLRVVRTDGRRPGFAAGAIREAAYYVDGLFFGLIAKQAMDGSPLQQRVGDGWADTTVVRANTVAGAVVPAGRLALGVLAGVGVEVLVQTVFVVLASR